MRNAIFPDSHHERLRTLTSLVWPLEVRVFSSLAPRRLLTLTSRLFGPQIIGIFTFLIALLSFSYSSYVIVSPS